MTLWHVTFASRLDAILRDGIVPDGRAPVVFAFRDYGDAARWAGTVQWTYLDDDDMPRLIVIVEFDADPAVCEAASDRTLDVPSSSVALRDGSVPPTAIRHVEVLVSALLSRLAS